MKRIKLFGLFLFLFCAGLIAQNKKFITYKVKRGESVESISKSLAITPYDLLKLNPDIKNNVKPDDIIIIPNKDYDPLEDLSNAVLTNVSDQDIIVGNFIYHEVEAKETIYSILRSFQVESDELNRHNPFLLENGLKIGQVLKIPLKIDEAEVEKKDQGTRPYLVQAKETKFSIARSFGITIEYLEELNPRISEEGLKIDDVILVPKEEAMASGQDYVIHKVLKMETMYSLTRKYELTAEELIELNPELSEGVDEGMLIKIPKGSEDLKPIYVDYIPDDKLLKVGMMLPFKSRQDTLDFEKNRLLQLTTDFYNGALLAVDSLKKQGLSVHIKVYDTENDKKVVDRISRGGELKDFDAVIGPMYLPNVKTVSNNLRYDSPLVVSPISTKDHSVIRNKNLIQARSSLENHTVQMLDYVESKYEQQDLIVIKNETEKSQQQFNRIIERLKALNPEKEVQVLETKEGYIKPEVFKVFRDTLDRGIVNWFFLTDNDPAYLGDVFNNLGVFPEVDSLMVFGFEKDRHFNKIDNNFLARVNFHYPTNVFFELDSTQYKWFENAYRKRYFDLPSVYALEGFDLTYDLLMRLAFDKDLIQQGTSSRIGTKYNYIENTSGSLLNQGVFIVKYEGLELKVLNRN